MSNDPRVTEAMRLHKLSTKSHHVWQTLRALGEQDERAQAAVDDHTALMTYLAAEFAKVPCIASDPRCPCNDGDTCNYVATKKTPAFEVPHPDAAQLISIADLLPTLSGADPAMLANVGHYLRGLSDRVKVLPVARTGPLRVAAEAVSAPVEAVPQVAIVKTVLHAGHDDEGDTMLYVHGVEVVQMSMCGGLDHLEELAEKINKATTTPPQAEPSLTQQLQNAREDFAAMKALTESGAAEIARLTAELQEVRKDATLPMSEAALEAAAKAMAEAFDYPWGHMPTVGRINMRTIAKNVIDAAMTKEKPTRTSRPLTADDFPPHLD